MPRYRSTLDVWTLDDSARAALQPGQWITAGPDGPRGRWAGLTPAGVAVAAWAGNAQGHPLGRLAYFRTLRRYALGADLDKARRDLAKAQGALALAQSRLDRLAA